LPLDGPAGAFGLAREAFRIGRFLVFALTRECFLLAIWSSNVGGTTALKSTVE
jgi:hypothetical protein